MKIKLSKLILIVMVIGFNLNYKIISVSGDSMLPTYQNHDLLLCKKFRKINQDDVVVFNHGKVMFKRVAATKGAKVKIVNSTLYINNMEVALYHGKDTNEFTLNEQDLYVLGDNYLNSYDSRNFGVIKLNEIICSIKSAK